jgi:hypothetical protein
LRTDLSCVAGVSYLAGATTENLRMGVVALVCAGRVRRAKEPDVMAEGAEGVMAVVHVKAPAEVDPHAIEAELNRAVNAPRKRPMRAEFALAGGGRTLPRDARRRHGFVGILSFAGSEPPENLERRVRKLARKALRRRFGRKVSAEVRTEMTRAEVGAYWSVVRGTPRHWP